MFISANRQEIHHDVASVSRILGIHRSHPFGRKILVKQQHHYQLPLHFSAKGNLIILIVTFLVKD
jgi:hypothetical protein